MREGSGGETTVDHGWDMPENVREGMEEIMRAEGDGDAEAAANGVAELGPFVSKILGIDNCESLIPSAREETQQLIVFLLKISLLTLMNENPNPGSNATVPSPPLAASMPTSPLWPTCPTAGSSAPSHVLTGSHVLGTPSTTKPFLLKIPHLQKSKMIHQETRSKHRKEQKLV